MASYNYNQYDTDHQPVQYNYEYASPAPYTIEIQQPSITITENEEVPGYSDQVYTLAVTTQPSAEGQSSVTYFHDDDNRPVEFQIVEEKSDERPVEFQIVEEKSDDRPVEYQIIEEKSYIRPVEYQIVQKNSYQIVQKPVSPKKKTKPTQSIDIPKQVQSRNVDGELVTRKVVRALDTPKDQLERGAKLYQCSECGLEKDEKRDVYDHINRVHSGCILVKSAKVKGQKRRKRVPADTFSTFSLRESLMHHFGMDSTKLARVEDIPFTEEGHRYKCSLCDYSGFFCNEIYKHVKRYHPGFTILSKKLYQANFEIDTDLNDEYKVADLLVNNIDAAIPNIVTVLTVPTNQRGCCYKCSKCDYYGKCTGLIYRHIKIRHKNSILVKKGLLDILATKSTLRKNVFDNMNNDSEDENLSPDELDVNDNDDDDDETNDANISDLPVTFGGYECSVCMESFSTNAELEHHVAYLCKGEEDNKEELYKILSSASNIMDSYGDQGNEDNLENDFANFSHDSGSNNNSVYVQDIPFDENGHRYKCSRCRVTSNNTGALYRHMQLHHRNCTILKRSAINGKGASDHNIVMYRNDESSFVDDMEHNVSGYGDEDVKDVLSMDENRTVKIEVIPKNASNHRYKCSRCEATGSCTSILYKHMKNKHPDLVILKKSTEKQLAKASTMSSHLTWKEARKSVDFRDNSSKLVIAGLSSQDESHAIANESENDGENQDQPTDDIIPIVQVVLSTKDQLRAGDKRFKCSACGHQDNVVDKLYKHMSKDHPDYRIRKRKIKDMNDYVSNNATEVYVVEVPDNEYKYKCSQCLAMSNYAPALYKHMEQMHADLKILRGIITSTTTLNESVSQSERTNTASNVASDNIVKCSVCSQMFASSVDLYNHMKTHQRVPDEIEVEEDVREITNSSGNGQTVTVIKNKIGHLGGAGKKFRCSLCGAESNQIASLYLHMKTTHPGCKIIKKNMTQAFSNHRLDSAAFARLFGFKCQVIVTALDSRRSSTKGHRYCCSMCSVTAARSQSLYVHIKQAHKSFIMMKRSEIFGMTLSDFVDENEEPPLYGQYSCPVCDVKTDTMDSLKEHITNDHLLFKTVKGETLWRDDVNLDRETIYMMNLLMDKSGNRFECSKCGYRSNNSSNIRKHMQYKHKDCIVVENELDTSVRHEEWLDSYIDDINNENAPDGENEGNVETIIFIIKDGEDNQKIFKCSICGFKYTSTKSVYSHMRRMHKGCKMNVVHENERLQDIFRTLETELNAEALADETNEGEEQDEESEASNVVKVILIPLNDKGHRYKCSGCEMSCASTGRLYKHMETAHPEFEIKKIRGSRANISLINDEGMESSGLDKFDGYECCICMKSFSSSAEMDEHYETHKDDENNAGDANELIDFDDEFQDDNIVDDNAPTVTVAKIPKSQRKLYCNRMYKCSLCECSSTCTASLYKHMKKCHPGHKIIYLSGGPGISRTSKAIDLNGCTGSFADKIIRAIKITSDINDHQYKCSKCSFTTVYHATLYRHMKEKHRGFVIVKKRLTSLCKGELTAVIRGLMKKPKPRSANRNGDSDAENDDRPFVSVKKLKKNYKDHKKYKCPLCNCRSTCTSSLYKHMKIKHKGYRINYLRKSQKPNVSRKSSDETEDGDIDESTSATLKKKDGEKATVSVIKLPDEEVENGQKYKCSLCECRSSNSTSLYKHMEKKHKNMKIVHLRQPKEMSEDKSNDETEANVDDDGVSVTVIILPNSKVKWGRKYKCSLCSCLGITPPALYQHMKRKHSDRKIVYLNKKTNSSSKKTQNETESEAETADFNSEDSDFDGGAVELPESSNVRRSGRKRKSTKFADGEVVKVISQNIRSVGIQNESNDEGDDDSSPDFDINDQADVTEDLIGTMAKVIKIPKKQVKNGRRYKCSLCSSSSTCTSYIYAHIQRKHKGHAVEYLRGSPVKSKNEAPKPMRRTLNDDVSDLEDEGRIAKVIKIPKDQITKGQRYKCSLCDCKSTCTSSIYVHIQNNHKDHEIRYIRGSEPKAKSPPSTIISEVKPKRKRKRKDSDDSDLSLSEDNSAPVPKRKKAKRNVISKTLFSKSKKKKTEEENELEKAMENDIDDTLMSSDADSDDENVVKVIKIPIENRERKGRLWRYKCSACTFEAKGAETLYQHMKAEHPERRIKYLKLQIDQSKKLKKRASRSKVDSSDAVGKGTEDANGSQNAGEGKDVVSVVEIPVDIKGHKYKCSKCCVTSETLDMLYVHMKIRHVGCKIVKTQQGQDDDYEDIENRDVSSLIDTIFKRNKAPNFVDDGNKLQEASNFDNENDFDDDASDMEEDDEMSEIDGELEEAMVIKIPKDQIQPDGKKYQCSLCNYKSTCTSALYKHMESKHKGHKIKYLRSRTGKRGSSASKTNEFEHEDEEYMDEDIDNEIDGEDDYDDNINKEKNNAVSTPSSKAVLTVFVVSVPESERIDGQRYKCSLCNQCSSSTVVLYQHMKVHHPERRIDFFRNPAISVEVTENVDTDIKPSEETLMKALEIAENKKGHRYKCSVCNYSAVKMNTVSRHMERYHANNDIIERNPRLFGEYHEAEIETTPQMMQEEVVESPPTSQSETAAPTTGDNEGSAPAPTAFDLLFSAMATKPLSNN